MNIDSIKNEAVLHCGINNMPADSVSKSVLCGYSGIKIKRAKTGKDGVNRSEAPEITVLFFLDDCVRYYSTKIYTLKKGAISNTSGAMYYKDIMSECGLNPEECLMVGNDVSEDMVAAKCGMKVFLLTDCLLNKNAEDISGYPQGGFAELQKFLELL